MCFSLSLHIVSLKISEIRWALIIYRQSYACYLWCLFVRFTAWIRVVIVETYLMLLFFLDLIVLLLYINQNNYAWRTRWLFSLITPLQYMLPFHLSPLHISRDKFLMTNPTVSVAGDYMERKGICATHLVFGSSRYEAQCSK